MIIYSSLAGSATLVMFWLLQSYLIEMNFPLSSFGVVLAVCLLITSFFSWNAERTEDIIGKKKTFVGLVLIPAKSFLVIGYFWSVWTGFAILMFYVIRGLNDPITLDCINGLISSDVRATVLSVRNLLIRLIFSAIGPFIGLTADIFSLKSAFLMSGGLFLAAGLVSIIFIKRHELI